MAGVVGKYTSVIAGDLSLTEVRRQKALLKGGAKRIQLQRPCTVGDGIRRLRPDEFAQLERVCCGAADAGRLSSFVPASGAATRMMAALVEVYGMSQMETLTTVVRAAKDNASLLPAVTALTRFEELPIWPAVKAHMAGAGRKDTLRNRLTSLLDSEALDAANTPKALIPFHKYGPVVRTPLFEHIQEAVALSKDAHDNVSVHFTVSALHELAARSEVNAIAADVEATLNVTFSQQRKETDTVALNADGGLATDGIGGLLTRPGGHGALLVNLQDVGGDVVLVKNIDNIVEASSRDNVVAWRRRLIGVLLEVEAEVHGLLRAFDRGESPVVAAQRALALHFGNSVAADPKALVRALNRPIRVAGMVLNDGQPGGGPFWVAGRGPQIVEMVQIDMNHPPTADALNKATHFNPVEMVLSLLDFKGDPFELSDFIDEKAVIINKKLVRGKEVTVLEHPGLWNGSMAGWNAVFVEQPRVTFQPVKVLADLLGSGHRTE
jgi:hypothetical protein